MVLWQPPLPPIRPVIGVVTTHQMIAIAKVLVSPAVNLCTIPCLLFNLLDDRDGYPAQVLVLRRNELLSEIKKKKNEDQDDQKTVKSPKGDKKRSRERKK
mmetsp:Transcript_34772/g.49364  ORF Transcript_34772/g.49364 Transcript_34772/m.49364 type:complete len:100 (+) Transcript_34772:74-373(+)